MRTTMIASVVAALLAGHARAADWFVDASRPDDSGDGESWAAAKKAIQAAIDIAAVSAGDTIWVTNGMYDAGGRVDGGCSNRVSLYKPVTLRAGSTNPANTAIIGAHDSGGPASMRCVYMVGGAALIGFTLTNGSAATTDAGAGVFCESSDAVVSNCAITDNIAYGHGGGAYGGTLYNCEIVGNRVASENRGGGGTLYSDMYDCLVVSNVSPWRGGGAYGGVLIRCRVVGNTTRYWGGGVANSIVYDSDLIGNYANSSVGGFGGGAAWFGSLYNCNIISNSARMYGGGTFRSVLYNCDLKYNSATNNAGGAYSSVLYNCLVAGNTARSGHGGGTYSGTNYNLTVVNNTASSQGGGVWGCISWNSIVYYNHAASGSNYLGSASFSYSCTAPGPSGEGNTGAIPLFAGLGANNFRLTQVSPCMNTGTNFPWMSDPDDARSRDADGNPRIQHNTVDMGAYELRIPKGTILMFRGQ